MRMCMLCLSLSQVSPSVCHAAKVLYAHCPPARAHLAEPTCAPVCMFASAGYACMPCMLVYDPPQGEVPRDGRHAPRGAGAAGLERRGVRRRVQAERRGRTSGGWMWLCHRARTCHDGIAPHKASTDPLPRPVSALQVADAVRKINATLIRRATMLDGAADDLKKGRGLGAGEGVGEAGEAPA